MMYGFCCAKSNRMFYEERNHRSMARMPGYNFRKGTKGMGYYRVVAAFVK